MEVESHDGTAYLPQAEMVYNGLGQRLSMTAYAGGLSLTTQYALDSEGGAAPLAATANNESTYYLYGLDAVAERAAGWNYYLRDGLGSLRKVVDADAGVTLERSYTPWGDVLTQSGSINPAQGYLGGWVDAATGLIYVGNGQYYDPHTGRFLTRDAQPGKFNPYVPNVDPTGLLIGPMALLVLARGRKGKKDGSKADFLIIAMVVLLAGGITITACNLPGGGGTETPDLPPVVGGTVTPITTPTTTPTQAQPIPPTSQLTPTATTCPSQTPRPLTEWETTHGQAIANAAHELLGNADQYYVWGADDHPKDEDDGWPPPREGRATWGFNDSIDLKERTGDRTPIVCADIVDLSYTNGGFDLRTSFPDWYKGYENPPTRHVGSLHKLVEEKGKLHQWGDEAFPELGDMIFFKDISHTGIVAEIQGDSSDPTMVFVIQASYSLGVINKMSLDKWQAGQTPVSFGHPVP